MLKTAPGLEETLASPLASTLARGANEADDLGELPQGTRLGRYVVLARLGAGGMGVVYAAYDPELDRKVAIKLLRPALDVDVEARARLQREAQAMAKLQHPNVITVHDVGTLGAQVWVAMEFVAGVTLRQWLRDAPRSWRELLAVMLAAGRGLAAAHERGLVHRDVKPDNIMVGEDGRARMMDFGLARGHHAASEVAAGPASDDAPERAGPAALREPLTRSGVLLGTPAYMAPEQFMGHESSALSDQYSWCVTLWEGLFGERPHVGDSLAELLQAARQRPRRPADLRGAPKWLRRALERGLEAEPARRHATMGALLERLQHAQRRARWTTLGAVFGAATVALAAATSAGWRALAEAGEACARGQEQLAGAWDAGRRAGLQAAFAGAPVAYARDTLARLEPELDAYAARWTSTYTAVCLAHQEGEISAELLDRRMACLRTRRGELRALLDVLTEGSAAAVENAAKAAGALVPAERCAEDSGAPARGPTAEQEADAQPLREELARAKAEFDAGLYDPGLARATATVSRARALGHEPLLAEALHRQGALLDQKGQFDAAEAALVEATALADANAFDELRMEASPLLAFVVGVRQGRLDEGERLSRTSWAVLRRVRGAPRDEQRVLLVESYLLAARGQHAQARERLERALELAEAAASTWGQIAVLNQLGNAALGLGDVEEAERRFTSTMALAQAELGPRHPQLVNFGNNLANVLVLQNRFDEAERVLLAAREVAESSLGPGHPTVAVVLDSLGLLYSRRGDFDRAVAHLEQALGLLEAALGSTHVALMPVTIDLLDARLKGGDLHAAREVVERALRLWEANGRATAVDEYLARYLLELVPKLEGDAREDVSPYLDVAFTIGQALGARGVHLRLAALAARAKVERVRGELERSRASLREAQEVAAQGEGSGDPRDLARARFGLALALWDAGERAPAVAEAHAAEALLRGVATPDEALQKKLSEWLAQVGSDRSAPPARR